MSYNYLPLDRKWLHFQQVKNLLDYDQLVSITFDAHERILKCGKFLDNSPDEKTTSSVGFDEAEFKSLQTGEVDLEKEMPEDIVKLLLMLKIKSLSHGQTAVHIDTVKRLMEMYNNGVYPVIYNQGPSIAELPAALSQLCRPLTGLGEVNFKGKKTESSDVLSQLKWVPISLKSGEANALTAGTHGTSAFALYALKKAEQLLDFADMLAALSFTLFGYPSFVFEKNIFNLENHKGQKESFAHIYKYLAQEMTASEEKGVSKASLPLTNTLQVHGAARDVFEHVLSIFLKEINAVTERPIILSEERLVLDSNAANEVPLILALNYFSIAMTTIGSISEGRIDLFTAAAGGSKTANSAFGTLRSAATETITQIKQLSTSLVGNSLVEEEQRLVNEGQVSGEKSLLIIEKVERILAIELIAAVQVWGDEKSHNTATVLNQLVSQFGEQKTAASDDGVSLEQITKAIEFIYSWKL